MLLKDKKRKYLDEKKTVDAVCLKWLGMNETVWPAMTLSMAVKLEAL
jgi:hypothetical protein